MDLPIWITIIVLLVALAIGFAIGKLLTSKAVEGKEQEIKKEMNEAKKKAESLIEDAAKEGEQIKKNKILEAKEKFLQMKTNHESELSNKNKKMGERERGIRNKEQSLNQKLGEFGKKEKNIDAIKENLNRQVELITTKKEDLDKLHNDIIGKLEHVAGLTREEAKEEMMEQLKQEASTQSMAYVKEIMDEAKVTANREAKKIIIQTIQRTAAEHTIENSVSVFNLSSDDQKGQIIGREGRNIRALESATGVEIIVDDTPEAIVISGFDPLRREIARLSLQRLVADGRIHPARIEEVVAKTRKQIEEQIMEIGERTVVELGVHGLKKELVRLVGKMRFRSSYGQNLLQHSKEVARLCATMAAELGFNAKLAKRAGLLHDIGKVPDEETELSHALLGMRLCEKYGEHPAVCNAVGAHHDEVEMGYVISPIIQVCDAISGARPGARREILEGYMKRITELENLAMAYDGVEKTYAIQAGRELRVIVESERVEDKRADELAFEISQKIQNEMQYPGQIKVTVIREKRAVGFAR